MMVMTAKVDIKKVIIVLAVIAAVIIGILALSGGNDAPTVATSAATVTNNENAIRFRGEVP